MSSIPELGSIRSYQCPTLIDGIGIESQARLSQRELQIIVLFSYGMTRNEVAESLAIVPDTVKNHMTNICSKLGLYSTPQVVAWYFNNLLLDYLSIGLDEIWRL